MSSNQHNSTALHAFMTHSWKCPCGGSKRDEADCFYQSGCQKYQVFIINIWNIDPLKHRNCEQ